MSTTTTTTTETRPPAPIDPRIKQRRIEVKRAEGRRRLRVMVVASSALALLVTGWGVTRSPLLDVDRIGVVGAAQTPAEDALRASGIRPGQAMVDVEEPAAARRVEALPWVDTARVTRRWPGTVRITVTERAPAVVLPGEKGGWVLADAEGRLLAPSAEVPEGLIAVHGVRLPGGPGATLGPDAAGALAVLAELPDELRGQVSSVTRGPDGDLELALVPEGVVRFGPPEDRGTKLAALATVLSRVDRRDLAVVDVRVPSAPVVTRS